MTPLRPADATPSVGPHEATMRAFWSREPERQDH
jgi:hypothetical protein